MLDSLDAFNPSLFSSLCEVSKGLYEPFIDIEETDFTILDCDNPLGKNIITCKNPNKNEFLKEVGGLHINTKLRLGINSLPSYIPIYDKSKIDLENEYIGITLKDVLKQGIILKAGTYHERNIVINQSILTTQPFRGKKVILFLTGADTLIEWVWHTRKKSNFFETIARMGFYAVCGFNFSVIGGECSFGQALNQKRSIYSNFLLENAGITSIPHVYCLNKFHVSRWISWFQANENIHFFVTNCQLQKSTADVSQVIKIIIIILKQMSNLHVILQGFPLDRISEFGLLLERIHFADKGAIKYALSKVMLQINGASKIRTIQNSRLNVAELIKHNTSIKEKYIQKIMALHRKKIKTNEVDV